jgi:hypothetical protein
LLPRSAEAHEEGLPGKRSLIAEGCLPREQPIENGCRVGSVDPSNVDLAPAECPLQEGMEWFLLSIPLMKRRAFLVAARGTDPLSAPFQRVGPDDSPVHGVPSANDHRPEPCQHLRWFSLVVNSKKSVTLW